MTAADPPPIVLIHGLWMTPRSWEHWVERYRARGHEVLAPSWPGLEGDVEALRADPTPLTQQSITKIVDHYEGIIRGLDSAPIIMGHSFGGTFTQLLLDRGLGRAGVGVDSSTVKGVLSLPLSTLRSAGHVLANPLNRGKAVPFSEKHFRYAFGNTMTEEQSREAWDRYSVPAAARVLFEGAAGNLVPNSPIKVDLKKNDRPPLLLIAGGKDHVVPAKVTRENVKRYGKSEAIVAYKEFPDRSHFTAGEPGWEAVADYALDWALDPKP